MCLCDRPLTHSSYVCRCVRLGWRTCTSPNPGSQATRGEKLDLSHSFVFTSQIRRREAGRRVCQRTATQQDADIVFRERPAIQQCASVVFRAIRAASPGVRRCVPTRSQECSAVQHCTPRVFRINQRAGMQLKYFGSIPRPQHELLRYERGPRPGLSHGAARRTLREWPALRRQRQRRAGGPGALQPGRLHHKPVLGQEQFQARAACSAPGQSCCHSRIG